MTSSNALLDRRRGPTRGTRHLGSPQRYIAGSFGPHQSICDRGTADTSPPSPTQVSQERLEVGVPLIFTPSVGTTTALMRCASMDACDLSHRLARALVQARPPPAIRPEMPWPTGCVTGRPVP